jgi:catechol 2,3-dioxygenase-like lactoylglutathione lyase family enzyme
VANGRRRPVAPVRKLTAAVLGTVATFVILFGLGMTSWSIVALGAAVLVLSVGLVVVRGGGRAWVTGVAHVHSASEPPAAYAFGRCELQLVIDAPGLPPRSKKVIEPRVPVAKWPDVGQALPIKIAIDDQRHVRVLWDVVPPPAAAAAAADPEPEFDGLDPLADDILIEEDAPPWAQRRSDEDFPMPPAEPTAADLIDDLGGLREEPVVVRQTPGGTIVLEGTLVEPPPAAPLPRRPRPSPHPGPDPRPRPDNAADEADPASDAPTHPSPAPDAPQATGRDPGPEDHPAALNDDALLTELFPPQPDAQTRAAGPIHGVGITLLVTDLDRSVGFYRDMLGFFEIDGGEGNAVLASGGTRLVLRAIPDVAPVNRRLVHLNLEVSDVNAVYEALKTKGVRFTYAPRAVNRGTKLELWAAAFRDPDGHGIALTQWRDRPAD